MMFCFFYKNMHTMMEIYLIKLVFSIIFKRVLSIVVGMGSQLTFFGDTANPHVILSI